MDAVSQAIHGKPDLVRHLVTAVIAGGHVLLEDVPGVGKTTLAHAIASALGCSFARIQFTADLLPSDVLGVGMPRPSGGGFDFHPGPVFAQVVLADEVNRTPPRTQSCLLEAMNEGQVSVDGEIHRLPRPFFVVATQNPLEHHGTFPLPESQIDRFLMRLSVGYPDRESERLLLRQAGLPSPEVPRVLDPDAVLAIQAEAMRATVQPELEDWILSLVGATRTHPGLSLGVSPRGTQALLRAAKARAFVEGRGYVVPDDVIAVLEPVFVHRLALSGAAQGRGRSARDVLTEILAAVSPPR